MAKACPRWRQALGELAGINPWPVSLALDKNLSGKVALISGGNQGIGYCVAQMLLRMRISRVYICCRKGHPNEPEESQVLAGLVASTGASKEQIFFEHVDFADFASVRDLAKRFRDTHQPLDLLFNNAGIASPVRAKTKDGFELHYEINYLSHALLTLELLPCLKAAPAARIISTSSCLHWKGGDINFDDLNLDHFPDSEWSFPKGRFLEAYGQAKLLLAAFSAELQTRLLEQDPNSRVLTFAVHPGHVHTAIFTQNYSRDAMVLTAFIWIATRVAITPYEGAKSLVKCAVSDEDDRATRGGRYFNRGWEATPRAEVEIPLFRREIWQQTIKDLGYHPSTRLLH
ncbi:uncharacterized protein L969DRAFT_20400 [Mixia osmundae IAM 14324]|uniref:Uncharacterized protein n=1 Tax=Mixia osmundae (strain CBS 9802 / IAM 14324 / JCM 22182 / KY 12970) TaxID=764103 RepID=G7DUM4_MIXOS|nr:uncharacterized protein L969DRAFT_20400 [Mixia osmundae IAM 14324]KEI36382.1 hypothetical protein L969DRAFT_20400 [Mixia osmundae IAM 14324]GAA94284.1 hypothetical protein E5Q_00933 [Mixia osmundae IAM 14324]